MKRGLRFLLALSVLAMLAAQPVVGTLTLQPFTSRILVPAGAPTPNLTIALLAPPDVSSSDWITYALSAVNRGGASATQLLVTDTLPAHTGYMGCGTRIGNVISWTAPSLAPVAGIKVIVNGNYAASAEGGYRVTGAPAVTLVDPLRVHLPLIARVP